MDTKTVGAVVATVKDLGDGESGNGEFEAIISTASIDRDGESIPKGAFDPLPDEIPIHINHDFTDVGAVVGRGKLFYDGDVLKVKGRYAGTPTAQQLRQLVSEGMVQTMSVGYIDAKYTDVKGVPTLQSADLIEASFVSVPANREALVLASKTLTPAPSPSSIGAAMGAQAIGQIAAAVKAVDGSYEHTQDRLREALRGVHPEATWLWTRGTFADRVVYEVEVENRNGGYESTTYEVAYTESDDGFTFGDPVEVDLSEIATPVKGVTEPTPETTSATDAAAKAASVPAGPSPAVAKAQALVAEAELLLTT